MTDDPAIAAIRRAVASAPKDVPLRLHLAQLLVESGRPDEAIGELSVVLGADPVHRGARELMAKALGAPMAGQHPDSPAPPNSPVAPDPTREDVSTPVSGAFDWTAAEDQLGDLAAPMFTGASDQSASEPDAAFDIERPEVRLTDVGGMQAVKDRLNAAFLAPLRNPELRKLFGKSLRGGMLLYGPPGCGKTFLAKALAGELGAAFLSAGLAEILDMWVGSSERNLHDLFSQARRNAPCVLFLDEIDALGQKFWRRPTSRGTSIRRCDGPDAWTARFWCCRRIGRPGSRSSAITWLIDRSRGSTWPNWPVAPRGSRGRTSPSCANRPANLLCWTVSAPASPG